MLDLELTPEEYVELNIVIRYWLGWSRGEPRAGMQDRMHSLVGRMQPMVNALVDQEVDAYIKQFRAAQADHISQPPVHETLDDMLTNLGGINASSITK
ncbi:hypothetical protein [Caudoviricetes sp.]|nr:hypothetical protein [Caudoviricetes sp.]